MPTAPPQRWGCRIEPGQAQMSSHLPRALSVAVQVSASTANCGPGFDAVGIGLGCYDEYAATLSDTPGLKVQLHGEGAAQLPRDASHLVARAMREGLAVNGAPWLRELAAGARGLVIECHNTIPMSAGMGSSASALVGGLGLGFALAHCLAGTDPVLSEADLAVINTRAGLWEGHPDNSSASVYGGLTVSWMPSAEVVRTARMDVHRDIEPVVLVPRSDRLATATARAALPREVPFGDAVRQAGSAALLTHALTRDPSLLFDATGDWLHQEQRRRTYPETMAAVDTLRGLGLAAVVSGAGPSVLVLTQTSMVEGLVAEVRAWGRGWQVLRPGVSATGLRLL